MKGLKTKFYMGFKQLAEDGITTNQIENTYGPLRTCYIIGCMIIGSGVVGYGVGTGIEMGVKKIRAKIKEYKNKQGSK